MENNIYNIFKILLIGESHVGKTEFISRFIDDKLRSENLLIPIGINFKVKTINFKGKKIKLNIWDISGQERIRNITQTFYKGAHALIFMYDVTDQNSFKNLSNWIKQVEAHGEKNLVKVLVGNNCDKLDRVVTEEEGKKLAEDFSIGFFETSPKTDKNVSEVFYYLIDEILKAKGINLSDSINLDVKYKKNKKEKCAK